MLRDIDGCRTTQMVANNPIMRPLILFLNETAQGVIRECPYTGLVKVENATWNVKNGSALEEFHRMQIFPNGQYKIIFTGYNKRDPNIVTLTFFADIYYRYSVLKADENF